MTEQLACECGDAWPWWVSPLLIVWFVLPFFVLAFAAARDIWRG